MTGSRGASGAGLVENFSPGEKPAGGMGDVLRDVATKNEPRVLFRPRSERLGDRASLQSNAQGEARRGGDRPGELSDGGAAGQPAAAAEYERGIRAGYAAAEAAQKAESEASHRAGFERGLKEGHEQGLSEGHRAGREAVEQGARAAREETSARLGRLNQLLAALPREMERRLGSAEEEMVALSHAVICRILGDQLLTRDGVAHYVRQAMAEATGGTGAHGVSVGRTAIHLNPRDLSAMEQDEALAAWMRQRESAPGGAQWVADEKVGPGGCFVHSAEGSLDARLETRMAALRQLLLQRDPEAQSAVNGAGAADAPAGKVRG